MTYSLTLRQNTGTYSLTWAELDDNFLFLEGLIATSSVAGPTGPQGASGSISGTPSEVPYFDSTGHLTSDTLFTRTSAQSILAYQVFPNVVTGLVVPSGGGGGETGSQIIIVNTSTGDSAQVGAHYPGSGSGFESVLLRKESGLVSGYLVNQGGVQYQSPNGSTRFTFPSTDGTNGQVMTTDGSGQLSFAPVSSSLPSGVDYQTLMLDGSGNPTWSFVFYDVAGLTSSDYGNRVSFDLFNQTSLNWETRQLRDVTSMLSLDWALRQLSSTTAMVLDFENLFLQDSSATQSVDWNNRLLKGSNGVQTLDWNNKNMSSTDGQGSIQWDARHLIADSNLVSLDWNNRQLLDTTQLDSLDWQNRNLVDASGLTISVAWQQRRMFQANGNISMDWDQLNLNDSTGFESIGFGDRNLWSKSAGTYVLNWDSQHMLTSTGSLILDWAGPNIELGSIATGHKLSIDPQGEFTFTTLLPSSNTLTTNGGVSGPFSGEGFSVDYIDIPTGGQGVLNIGSNPATGTASVVIGYFGGQSNFIQFTDTNVQITSQNSQSLWPTTNGAPNEVMATDGSGNLFFKPITLPYVYSTQSDAFVYPIVNNTINVIDTTGSVVTSCSFDIPNAPNDGDVFELKILGAGLTGVSWFPSVSGANVIYPPTALPASNQVYKWVYDVNLNLFV